MKIIISLVAFSVAYTADATITVIGTKGDLSKDGNPFVVWLVGDRGAEGYIVVFGLVLLYYVLLGWSVSLLRREWMLLWFLNTSATLHLMGFISWMTGFTLPSLIGYYLVGVGVGGFLTIMLKNRKKKP